MGNPRPIKRNKYISERELELYTNIGRDFLENDLGQEVYYYKIDLESTQIDDLYGESYASDIVFENPVVLYGRISFADAEQKSYDEQNKVQYVEIGNMMAHFYDNHLKEQNVTFSKGDYIAYRFSEENVKFYQITHDGRDNESLIYTFAGKRPFFTSIIAAPVDRDKINVAD